MLWQRRGDGAVPSRAPAPTNKIDHSPQWPNCGGPPAFAGGCLEAYDRLAPAYDWFTEGFGTPDLKEAKALLGKLAG